MLKAWPCQKSKRAVEHKDFKVVAWLERKAAAGKVAAFTKREDIPEQ